MAEQARPTPSQAPEPTYVLEWEPRVQRPKRRSRLSRLFPIGGGGAAPEADPEAVAPAPAPPPPPRRPSSLQRKPLPNATPPAAPSTSDDDLAQQASLAKETQQQQQQQQHQPHLPHGETPGTFRQTEEPPMGSDKFAAGVGAAARSSRRRARLDAAMPPDRKYLGMRRRVFLIAAAVALLLLLALIIGLAAGLSVRKRNKDSQGDLPLPGRDGGRTHEGELTFYDPGLGACGGSHGGGDLIAAVARTVFDAAADGGDGNPNNNPICGKTIRVERGDGSVDVTVVDRCGGCKNFDLDLSPSAFQRLAREGDGRVVGQWRWL